MSDLTDPLTTATLRGAIPRGQTGEVPVELDSVPLSAITPEPVTWFWADRIAAGKLTLLIGHPGVGKSYVSLDVAARLSTGMAWPAGAGQAPLGEVLLFSSEDGEADTVRPIVDRQHGNPDRIHVVRGVCQAGQSWGFTLERDLPPLEATLQKRESTKAVIISPLSAYLGSKDAYRDAEVRALLTPLAALAERRKVAILGIMHLTKDSTRRVLLRVLGSVAFTAQARLVLLAGEENPQQPDRRLIGGLKNNMGLKAPVLAFRIGDAGLTWEQEIVAGNIEDLLAADLPATRTEILEREQAATFLRDLLRDGPTLSKDLMADARANGIAERTLWRAKRELGIVAEQTKGVRAGGWYWMLPK